MGYIYKITNINNGMMYVGQTVKERPTDRFSQHKYLANHLDKDSGISYLHRAMAKEGSSNFQFEIIEEVDNDLLNEREKYWISVLNTLVPNGYNLSEGGSGTPGYSRQQTIEERLKRQESNKKFFIDHPEARQEASERTKKLWENEEYRKKVTESNKKFYAEHPDFFKGKNNPFYGKHHSEESLAKIKSASKKRQKAIAQLDKDTLETIQIFDGIKDAEKFLGVSHGWLSKAARQNKVAYGYRWKFIESVTTNEQDGD